MTKPSQGFEITQYSICIPLTGEQWDALMKIDNSGRKQWPKCYDRFIKDIQRSGAMNVEFNGHFGRNFYFDVEKVSSASRVLKKLTRLLK